LHTLKQKITIDVARPNEPRYAAQTINIFQTGEAQWLRRDAAWLDVELRIDRVAAGYRVEMTLNGEQHFGGLMVADAASWISTGDSRADGRSLFKLLFADDELLKAWGMVRGRSKQRRVRALRCRRAGVVHAVERWAVVE
jgi:hypothetical protein